MEFIKNDVPDRLYKYRGFNEYSLSIFINKELFFASPQMFNDPFDCQLNLIDGLEAVREQLEVIKTLESIGFLDVGAYDEMENRLSSCEGDLDKINDSTFAAV